MSGVWIFSYVALWAVVLVLSVAVFALYHHFGEMYLSSREGRASQGPEPHEALPSSRVNDIRGNEIEIPPPGRPALILFATTSCPLCERLLPALSDFAERAPSFAVMIVCGGDSEDVTRWAAGASDRLSVVPDKRRRLASRYRIGLTPFLVGVDDKAAVQVKGIINDEEALVASARMVDPERAESLESGQGKENELDERVAHVGSH